MGITLAKSMGLPVLRRPLLVKELAYVFIMLYHTMSHHTVVVCRPAERRLRRRAESYSTTV